MKIFPSICIKNGHCVTARAEQFHDSMMYTYSPEQVARGFESAGAELLHVVDIDGAMVGHSVNEMSVKKVIDAVSIPVEVGGGIRSIKAVESMLKMGASRVIVSTQAVGNPGFIKDAVTFFGEEKIVVAIDAKNGMVVMEGWEKTSRYDAVSFAIKMREAGIKTIQYTDITKDGRQLSPNPAHIEELVKATGLNIIASGAIASLKDLELLEQAGVYGVIIDRALYEKKIDFKEAKALFDKIE